MKLNPRQLLPVGILAGGVAQHGAAQKDILWIVSWRIL